MVKAVELKRNDIIIYERKSYYILDVFPWNVETESGEEPEQITVEVTPVSCSCGGNLEKLGRRKGQYKCLECGRPVYLDGNGEFEKCSTSN